MKGRLSMSSLQRRIELPLVGFLFLIGSAFLLKMCYLSLAFNTVFGIAFLAAVYFYLRTRFALHIPIALLLLVFTALQVDALGNYFGMYGERLGPMQYDEFSHLIIQVLVTPIGVWLLNGWLAARGYNFSLALTSFFAGTLMFSFAAFYEIIELWDEIYFHGQRIWSKYDTATDLQWDLCGIAIGLMFANLVLRRLKLGKSHLAPTLCENLEH
jgi:uncharacterized membrane protein YjdF